MEAGVIFALHIAPEYEVGTVAVKEGLLFANTSELFIQFKGKGGHAAYPHHTKDMIVVASSFVTQLQSIVLENVDPVRQCSDHSWKNGEWNGTEYHC